MKINRGIVSQKSKERIAMKSKKQTLLAVSSMMGFIVLWATVTDAWNYSAFLFPRHPPVNRFLYGYLSRILWMFPAFILIRRFDKCLYRSGKQMFSKPKAEPGIHRIYGTDYGICLGVDDDRPGAPAYYMGRLSAFHG